MCLGEYIAPVGREPALATAAASPSSNPTSPTTSATLENEKVKKEETTEKDKNAAPEIRGDPEVAPKYVRHLLPVFTDVFHVTMLASVR